MAIPLKENDPGMPEPSERPERVASSDVPTYDTYPAEPPRTSGWRPADRQLSAGEHNPRLDEGAEKIGALVGDAVVRGREAMRKFGSMRQEVRRTSESKVQELTEEARDRWSNARATAQQRLEDWRDAARESAENARQTLVQRTREARIRAKDYVDENPQHVLLAIAGAAFAIGLTARIMRSSRD